ncbi:thioredoxin domain-containing protein [Leucobacter coleopterorum]|uniref:Thioredoxin domain-containing protein n=1 Tax=Leucobacter coleopterorum TaxID=2714933 RepID=A0ABX6K207_9MICO|nr:thioredoxin domain-containing protein [Leucobacter coleopterorum]QIM19070.1 thioredoxin domain-containing protein [Leucobacter coleopterorum]
MSTPEMPTVSTPPPHPYATVPNNSNGRGFAIAAMAAGLLSLLTTVVGVFYGAMFVFVGIGLAIIAIGLGITALILKQRPIAPSIVGLGSGVLSLLSAVVVGTLVMGGTIAAPVNQEAGSSNNSTPSQGIEAKWPSNMASGGVLFLGGSAGGGEVATSAAPANGAAPDTSLTGGSAAPKNQIQLYVDYMCPACGAFEATNLDTIESALAGGDTSLELRPLTFLDGASQGSYYSSRASAALACVVDSQPELAWKTHTALLDPNNQPEEGTTGPDNKQLISMLNKATGGLSDTTQSCITEETYVPFAQGLSAWLLNSPVPNAKDPRLMVSSTPTAVVNGTPYSGSITDAAAFKKFLTDQGVTLK